MKATQTQHGFTIGDTNGVLLDVKYACGSQDGDRRRWAAVRIFCANGDVVDVDASPRRTTVNHKPTAGKGRGKNLQAKEPKRG